MLIYIVGYLMDPLVNSKMILLNEIKLIQTFGLELPNNKVLTINDYLEEIIFYNQFMKQQHIQKYGNLNYEESKEKKLEKSVDKFLNSLIELNNTINENYSFDPYNMMLNHIERFSITHNYCYNRDQLDSMLKLFIKNKLMDVN